jgi:tetratricopeptide (TPR) repeat protein
VCSDLILGSLQLSDDVGELPRGGARAQLLAANAMVERARRLDADGSLGEANRLRDSLVAAHGGSSSLLLRRTAQRAAVQSARACHRSGLASEALRRVTAVLEPREGLEPLDGLELARAQMLRGLVLSSLDRKVDAIPCMEKAAREARTESHEAKSLRAQALLMAGVYQFETGSVALARTSMEHMIREFDEVEDDVIANVVGRAMLFHAHALYELGEFGAALEAFDLISARFAEGLELGPMTAVEALVSRARTLDQLNQLPEALAGYELALDKVLERVDRDSAALIIDLLPEVRDVASRAGASSDEIARLDEVARRAHQGQSR